MVRVTCPRSKALLTHPTPDEKVQCSRCGQRIRVPTPPLMSTPYAPLPPNRTVLGELPDEPHAAPPNTSR
jgi:hypothetical protein